MEVWRLRKHCDYNCVGQSCKKRFYNMTRKISLMQTLVDFSIAWKRLRKLLLNGFLDIEKAKSRITALPCAYKDGSEKIELLFTETSAKPRAFKKKSGSKLSFNYVASKKAWMTCGILFGWLQNFYTYTSKTINRDALLMIDKCSAHRTSGNLPVSPNVEVVFLPFNSTSRT